MSNKDFHICHLTTVHAANDNRIFHKECLSLARAGYRVTLLAGRGQMVEGPVNVRMLNIPGRRLLRMSVGVLRLLRQALRERADVYHFHDPELIPAALWLRLRGHRVVVDVHENVPAAFMSKPYLVGPLKYLVAWLSRVSEQLFYPRFSALITARPDISARFTRLNPVTLKNYPILPDLDDVVPAAPPAGPPGVIYVGGLSPIRGIRELITAFDGLKEARLWLLGPFESEEFRQECEALPGWENTHYFGVVGPQEIYGYLKAAKAGIITFLPYPNHITTLATKPFEYMAAGLPVIMSDFDYWRETFGDNAIYTDPADPGAIRAAVMDLFASQDRIEEISKRNLELADNIYRWCKEEDQLLELYDRLLSNG